MVDEAVVYELEDVVDDLARDVDRLYNGLKELLVSLNAIFLCVRQNFPMKVVEKSVFDTYEKSMDLYKEIKKYHNDFNRLEAIVDNLVDKLKKAGTYEVAVSDEEIRNLEELYEKVKKGEEETVPADEIIKELGGDENEKVSYRG